ncbi:ABC transporter permease [Neobacillus notoginsengisoli]|uniref:ABC transporter permease n=1 Tax=Neobacillus notoginsengisoli TaxID=1578198 RepID=A0A417YPD3_9BACI|nr:ABC transporter permease [Neobacillus notoginsengisoli]RHW35701.1 ABC transporter permease [Neobacillus notoginsengisoli]
MRKTVAILLLHLKSKFRTSSVWVLMIVMPLVFSFIFGGMAGDKESNKPLVLYAVGSGEISVRAADLLTANDQYNWKKVTAEEAKSEVKEQKAIAAVMIADRIEDKIAAEEPLFDVIVQRETQEYLALYPHLEGAARTIVTSHSFTSTIDGNALPVLLQKVSNHKGIKVEKEIIQKKGKKGENVSIGSLGFTIMFMMFGISAAAATILEERAGGTWARLMTTPASRSQIISGYILSYFLMGWIQLGVMALSIKLFFNGSLGNPLYFIPFASLVILTVVGLGLMIAGLVKTKQQAGAISAVIIVSTCMLGGVYWPLDVVPDFMKLIAKFVPQSWMMSGVTEIVSGSMNGSVILSSVFVLIGFSVLFFFVGLRKLKYET